MIKTLIILILLVLLLGIAYLTRPSEASFRSMIQEQAQAKSEGALGGIVKGVEADLFLSDVTFRDRYLWITADKGGRTIYIGAFAHWFDTGALKEAAPDNREVKIKLPA